MSTINKKWNLNSLADDIKLIYIEYPNGEPSEDLYPKEPHEMHEVKSYYYFIREENFTKLFNTLLRKHDFDGLFLKEGKVFFHEAKFLNSTTTRMIYEANKTIETPSNAKRASLQDVYESPEKVNSSDILLINEIITRSKKGEMHGIPNNRKILSLGKKGKHKDIGDHNYHALLLVEYYE